MGASSAPPCSPPLGGHRFTLIRAYMRLSTIIHAYRIASPPSGDHSPKLNFLRCQRTNPTSRPFRSSIFCDVNAGTPPPNISEAQSSSTSTHELQDGRKMAQDGFKMAARWPNMATIWPKMVSRWPKIAEGSAEDGPRWAPRWPKEGSKIIQKQTKNQDVCSWAAF